MGASELARRAHPKPGMRMGLVAILAHLGDKGPGIAGTGMQSEDGARVPPTGVAHLPRQPRRRMLQVLEPGASARQTRAPSSLTMNISCGHGSDGSNPTSNSLVNWSHVHVTPASLRLMYLTAPGRARRMTSQSARCGQRAPPR